MRNNKTTNHYNFIDITGKKFFRLLAIEPVQKEHSHGVYWRCICDCGNETIQASQSLRNGIVKSCGCWRKEVASLRGRKSPTKVTYSTVHGMVRKERGRASDHICVCGTNAKHWSYNHEDLDEVEEMVSGTLTRYSQNINFYEPLCFSCHKNLDNRVRILRVDALKKTIKTYENLLIEAGIEVPRYFRWTDLEEK